MEGKQRLLLLGAMLTLLLPVLALAKGNPVQVPLVLGQSCALSGPAKDLGVQLRGGLLAAFSKVNEEGGINGREIELITKDDGYEPDRAVRNSQELITRDRVFMLIGLMGTPTAKSVLPLVEEYQVPFFAPFSGAEFLREPFRKYVVNVRGSYSQEMEKLIEHLIVTRKVRRIACFYQNDSYGFAGLEGVRKALIRRNMTLVATGSYERNTVAVMGALNKIYQAKPEAVILVGAYTACTEFIKLSRNRIDRPIIFGNISFVGTESLKETLGSYGKDVLVSQVVPLPNDLSIPLVREYQQAMRHYQHDVPLTFVSLEGYIDGKLFAQIAGRIKGEITREKFMATMEDVRIFDLGGLLLQFGSGDHQGLDSIYLTTIYPTIEELRGE